MPPKTTVTIEGSSRTSSKKAPRVTVNTGDTKQEKKIPSKPAGGGKTKVPTPSTPTATMSNMADDARNRTLLGAAVGLFFVCFLCFYAWKGLVSVSSETIATRVEKKLSDEQEKNREAEKGRTSTTNASLGSLERKIDESMRDNRDTLSKFEKKAEEHEKGMLALVDAVNEIKGHVAQNLKDSRREASKEIEKSRKQTLDEVRLIATQIEDRLKQMETSVSPPPKVTAPAVIPEETRAVAASTSKRFEFEGEKLHPGEMSKRYCVEDIKLGKILISKKPGIVVRNHLHLWRSAWIDSPVPPSGTFTTSPHAKYVSFYSLSETFTVERTKI